MSTYHEGTLALLGLDQTVDDSLVVPLKHWAHENEVTLPIAYVEWVSLGGQRLLERYSNQDSFPFDQPQIVATPDGRRGLLFHEENQGNYQLIALLDHGDDPPVLFGWCAEPPWVRWCERFSGAVFAQIFDWQYRLVFDPEYPDEGEITFYGSTRLRSSGCLGYLREHFEETVTTEYSVDGERGVNYRFWRTPEERITLTVPETGACHLCVTAPYRQAVALDAELLEALNEDVIPQTFGAVLSVTDFLERALREGWWTQLRHACLRKPDPAAIERLRSCNDALALSERASGIYLPQNGDTFILGGETWGVTIRLRYLRAEDPYDRGWTIESID